MQDSFYLKFQKRQKQKSSCPRLGTQGGLTAKVHEGAFGGNRNAWYLACEGGYKTLQSPKTQNKMRGKLEQKECKKKTVNIKNFFLRNKNIDFKIKI